VVVVLVELPPDEGNTVTELEAWAPVAGLLIVTW
jgi:hypothetical protein